MILILIMEMVVVINVKLKRDGSALEFNVNKYVEMELIHTNVMMGIMNLGMAVALFALLSQESFVIDKGSALIYVGMD